MGEKKMTEEEQQDLFDWIYEKTTESVKKLGKFVGSMTLLSSIALTGATGLSEIGINEAEAATLIAAQREKSRSKSENRSSNKKLTKSVPQNKSHKKSSNTRSTSRPTSVSRPASKPSNVSRPTNTRPSNVSRPTNTRPSNVSRPTNTRPQSTGYSRPTGNRGASVAPTPNRNPQQRVNTNRPSGINNQGGNRDRAINNKSNNTRENALSPNRTRPSSINQGGNRGTAQNRGVAPAPNRGVAPQPNRQNGVNNHGGNRGGVNNNHRPTPNHGNLKQYTQNAARGAVQPAPEQTIINNVTNYDTNYTYRRMSEGDYFRRGLMGSVGIYLGQRLFGYNGYGGLYNHYAYGTPEYIELKIIQDRWYDDCNNGRYATVDDAIRGAEIHLRPFIQKTPELATHFGEIREGFDVIKEELIKIEEDTQGLKEDTQGLKEDTQGLKEDTQGLKDDMQEVKTEVQETKIDPNLEAIKRELIEQGESLQRIERIQQEAKEMAARYKDVKMPELDEKQTTFNLIESFKAHQELFFYTLLAAGVGAGLAALLTTRRFKAKTNTQENKDKNTNQSNPTSLER